MQTTIKPKSPFTLLDINELLRYKELFYIFVWRDIKVRYKQTLLGFAWVLFQPLITMIILSIFFGSVTKNYAQNIPYPLFVLVGIVFWTYCSAAITRASDSFIENEELIKKIYFPRMILPLSSVLTALVDFSITLLLLICLLFFYRQPISSAAFVVIPLCILITTFFAAGVGLFMSSINVKYRDVRYILPFFIQLLLFISPVIYTTDALKPPLTYFFILNPLSGVIESARKLFDIGSPVDYLLLPVSFTVSVLYLLAGLAYFRSTELYFADIV